MDTILLIILVSLLGTTLAILYLNIRSKPKSESKESEEIANLKTEIVTLKDTLNNSLEVIIKRINAQEANIFLIDDKNQFQLRFQSNQQSLYSF